MAGKKESNRADGSYSDGWRSFSKLLLRPGIRMMMRLDWRGQEHIPADGPVILAINHLSYMDILAIGLFVDSARRYPVFLAKSSLFKIPVLGYAIGKLGQLPVYRGQADAALVLRQAAELARKNNACVIFYPESTVTRDPDKWPMVAKTGVARLALEIGAPVIPVAHWGAQRILPYGDVLPRLLPRKTVKVAAGPAVDLSEFAGQPPNTQVLRAVTDKIMQAVTGLVGELRGETPPAHPYQPVAPLRSGKPDQVAPASDQEALDQQPAGRQALDVQVPEQRVHDQQAYDQQALRRP